MNTDRLRCARENHSFSLHRCILLGYLGGIALVTLSGMDLQPTASASLGLQQDEKLKDSQFIAEGSTLFARSCGNAYCHGTGGVGGGAPRLRGKGLDAAYLFKTIANGIPGTGMLSFKAELSEEQIRKLVAFIMADAKTGSARSEAPFADKPSPRSPTVPVNSAAPAAASSLAGDAQAGRGLFFESGQAKSCQSCHSFAGEGTPIGPDLSKLGTRSARELFLNIIMMRENTDSRYATVSVTLKNGDKIRGVKKEEDSESIRVYDTAELPAVLRTVQKIDVVKVESRDESVMPKDYASIYTMKQLLDLVTFLKSSESKSPVTLKDLLGKD
jgi:putative heme-binding domain-containing protein